MLYSKNALLLRHRLHAVKIFSGIQQYTLALFPPEIIKMYCMNNTILISWSINQIKPNTHIITVASPWMVYDDDHVWVRR